MNNRSVPKGNKGGKPHKRLFFEDLKNYFSHLIQEVIRNALKYPLHKLVSWLHNNLNGLGLNYNWLEGPSIIINGL